MKRAGIAGLVFFLFWPLGAASRASETSGLPRMKNDFSAIICSLLSCYDQSRERRFLETAIYFGEIRTHPIFELTWGKRRRYAAAEQRLLRASARLRGRLRNGDCLPRGSERDLCRLAQEYIQVADRDLISARKVTLDLPAACSLGQMQKRLAAGQVLLKYILLEDRILLFFIGADAAGYEFLDIGRSEAVAMVNRLSEPLEDFANGRVDYLRIHFDMELAHRLFNILLKKIVERFPQANELFIIPDQELFKLPFEALVTGFNENFQQEDVLFSEYQAADYVIQKYKVSYFFSHADFLRNFSGPRDYRYTLAAFGHPLVSKPARGQSFQKRQSGSAIADIPSTRLEILSLEKLFSASRRRIFLGADFNRENFSCFAPQAKLIHLATHFFNDEKDPSRSAFLFSASGKTPSLCDARQILELRLRAELVILSACETSEKNLMGFKLLSGMTAAIRQTGVRDLIASLWPVDEFSSQIVPLFYREYLSGGDSAAALRNAKLVLFEKTIAIQDGVRLSLAHPFLWANYVLYHFYR
jgi:CHAT domain-containing protein